MDQVARRNIELPFILFIDNYVIKEMTYKEAIEEFAAENLEKRYYRNISVCSFSRFYHFD